jgi:hypothetical protein
MKITLSKLGRPDLEDYLAEFRVTEVLEFDAVLNQMSAHVQIVSGGFGYPHIIATVWHGGRPIELALMESPSYKQDGDDPLTADGWGWRLGKPDLLSGGWSDLYSSAGEALRAAIENKEAETK